MKMNDTELEKNLQNHYQKLYGVPPTSENLWQQIAPRLIMQEQNLTWWQQIFTAKQSGVTRKGHLTYRPPLQRIAIVLAALLLGFLVISATSYAATGGGPLKDLFHDLGLQPLAQQFTDYQQSKSIDGYTFTIHKVYADANRVIIGYTNEIPTNIASLGQEDKLTTEQGIALRPIEGATSTEEVQGNVFSFDASNIQGTPKELHLHLAIPYGSQTQSGPFQIKGYLTFDFTTPFHAGKLINIKHAVTAPGTPVTKQITSLDNGQKEKIQVTTLNGQTVTLQKVVISPSEVRTYITGFKRSDYTNVSTVLDFRMTVMGKTYNASTIDASSDVWQANFDKSLLESKRGIWTLTIEQNISQVNPKTGKFETEPVPGALWSFQFTVE